MPKKSKKIKKTKIKVSQRVNVNVHINNKKGKSVAGKTSLKPASSSGGASYNYSAPPIYVSFANTSPTDYMQPPKTAVSMPVADAPFGGQTIGNRPNSIIEGSTPLNLEPNDHISFISSIATNVSPVSVATSESIQNRRKDTLNTMNSLNEKLQNMQSHLNNRLGELRSRKNDSDDDSRFQEYSILRGGSVNDLSSQHSGILPIGRRTKKEMEEAKGMEAEDIYQHIKTGANRGYLHQKPKKK